MPGTTIRQTIVNAIDARFKTITPANGYNFDLSSKVFQWRDPQTEPYEVSQMPCLNFRDGMCAATSWTNRHTKHELTIEVDVVVSSDTTTPADVRKMIADVIKSISVDRTWGVTNANTFPMEDEIEVIKDGKRIGGGRIKFKVQFLTLNFDPYNQ